MDPELAALRSDARYHRIVARHESRIQAKPWNITETRRACLSRYFAQSPVPVRRPANLGEAMPHYCVLMTVNTSTLSGKIDDANVNWVSPDDTNFGKSPGRNTQKFYKADNVSVALQILDSSNNNQPMLPKD